MITLFVFPDFFLFSMFSYGYTCPFSSKRDKSCHAGSEKPSSLDHCFPLIYVQMGEKHIKSSAGCFFLLLAR